MAQTAGNSEVESRGLLNLRLALMDTPLGATATGELSLWIRNVLDEDTATNFIDFGPGFGNLRVANFVEPRMFGVTAQIRF